MTSLASRCPACHTVFRVVPDQLRVSAGWVRCGRCAEVFNASENLVDAHTGEARPSLFGRPLEFQLTDPSASSFVPPPPVERPQGDGELPDIAHGEFVVDPYAPVRRPPPKATPRPFAAVAPAAPAAPTAPTPEPMPRTSAAPARPPVPPRTPAPTRAPTAAHLAPPTKAAEAAAPTAAAAPPQPPAAAAAAHDTPTTASPRARSGPAAEISIGLQAQDAVPPPAPATEADSDGAADEAQQLDLPLEQPRVATEPHAAAAADLRADASARPSFIVEAERAERWRRPGVRLALAAASAVAALLLAAQVLYAERDQLAARSPLLQPLLAQMCEQLACRITAPRAIEALRVESSGLVRVDRSDLYRLTLALRNQRDHDVALPALELSLTDSFGQLISRRVLRTSELGASIAAVGGGAEITLQSTLQVAAAPVAGYTIELFYP